jgi:large subunit ribosomal protein L1
LVTPDKDAEAKEAGADYVGLDEYLDKIKNGWTDVDVIVTMPAVMGKLGPLGRVLGPRGLMPNPKLGTVTADIATAVKNAKSGQVEYRVEKAGIIHAGLGKISFAEGDLLKNAQAFISSVVKAKPAGAKGVYLKKVHMSSTMGPSLNVDLSTISN